MAIAERTSIQSVGGGVGTYPMYNPYGNALAQLVIHSIAGSGATTSAYLDVEQSLNPPPAALPTLKNPWRGAVYTSIGQTNSYGPMITDAEGSAAFVVLVGSAWITYQWQRVVPDPAADSMNRTAQAVSDLIEALKKGTGHPPGCTCWLCGNLRDNARNLGDHKLADRI